MLQKPYDYQSTADDVYTFKTDYRVNYIAYFTEASHYFSDYPEIKDTVLNFGCAPDRSTERLRGARDGRVQYTVIAILEHYLEVRPEAIIFFVCDTRDRQHLARKILFDKWFSSSEARKKYNKIDEDICAGADCAHCSIIFSKKHPYATLALQSFSAIALQIRNK